MSLDPTVSYYSGAKYLAASYLEGVKGDTISNYINRENWSDKDRYTSNVVSNPADKFDKINPSPDYIVYYPQVKSIDSSRYAEVQHPQLDPSIYNSTQAYDLLVLLDPENSKIPSNFELLYKSDITEAVVYKINKKS